MNYTIGYNVYLKSGNHLYGKIIRVKNKDRDLLAKVALEDYLKRKHGNNFMKLEITSCNEDNQFNNDFMSWFGSQFG